MSEQLLRWRPARIGRAVLAMVVLTALVTSIRPSPAAAVAAWQLTVTRIDPSPSATGSDMLFRINAQCSAIDEAVCRDSVITWPGDSPNTFTAGSHPAIESLTYDGGGDEWTLDLSDRLFAGGSLQLSITASAPNHTTPDGTTVTLDATITSSNTASATGSAAGEWSASGDLVVNKYTQFGIGADMILDFPVKYYLNPCDPTFVQDEPGHLYPVDMTLIDTLPAGVTFSAASAGGVFDSGANTVTWTEAGPIVTEDCSSSQPTDFWVEVEFPSTVFGADAVPPQLTAQNDVSISGYPVGAVQDGSTILTDNDSVVHGFTVPSADGIAYKSASTPYFGFYSDYTFAEGPALYQTSWFARSGNTSPYYYEIVDRMPCLTNDTVDDDVNTVPNYYRSLDSGICTEPAFQPDHLIQVEFYTLNHLEWTDSAARRAWLEANPTLPIRYESTLGASGIVNMPLTSSTTTLYPNYGMSGADFMAAAGFAPGEQLATVTFDSRDAGLRVSPGSSGYMTYFRLYGNTAADTLAYPMGDQTRVYNQAEYNAYEDPAGAAVLTGTSSDEVVIVPPQPSLAISKYDSSISGNGYFSLDADITGTPMQDGEQIVVTDLLPLGYEYAGYRSIGYDLFNPYDPTDLTFYTWDWYRYNVSSTPSLSWTDSYFPELAGKDPFDYITLEIIDNYAGTGRQLVRATFDPPPFADGWPSGLPQGDTGVGFDFFVTPSDLSIPATNEAQVFPTHPITEANLVCANEENPYTNYPPLAEDPYDLDNDGATTLDTYCQAGETLVGDDAALFLSAEKSVQGDLDPTIQPFPAIGAVTEVGGSGTFEIAVGNAGAVSATDLVIYDVLPHVGDTALTEALAGAARGSEWEVTFDGIDAGTVPAGTQIEYSASNTACRDELATTTTPFPTGCTNDWSTSLPAGGVADVRALRITFTDDSGGLLELDPGERFAIRYDVTYPAGLTPGEVAWNSFAYAGNRGDDSSAFLPSEPPKVGLSVPLIDLEVDKVADSPSTVSVGETVSYTITVDHAGDIADNGTVTAPSGTAYNVNLLDDAPSQGLTIVPGSSRITHVPTSATGAGSFNETTGAIVLDKVGPNDSFEITYDAYLSVEGSITNSVEITSHPNATDTDSTPGNDEPTEDDQDTAIASWVTTELTFDKLVESARGSGSFIEADSSDGLSGDYAPYEPVTYRFVVENTGTDIIYSASLSDDLTGFECDQSLGTLSVGELQTIDCTWPYGYAAGTHVNTATVTGTPDTGGTITVSDTAEVVVTPKFDLSLIVTPASGQTETDVAFTDTDVAFDVTVRNQGDVAPTAPIEITSYIPTGFYLDVAATNAANTGNANITLNGDGTVTVATLDPLDTETFTVVITSDDPATAGTVENLKSTGELSIVYGAEISDDSAPGATPDFDSTPDATNDDTVYDGPDSHNNIGHVGEAYDQRAEDEDDHDTEELTVAPSTATVGDLVWQDLDGDGIQDIGEPGIAGVTVTLDPGTPGDTGDDLTDTTDIDGNYSFTLLEPGTYTVTFTQPSGTALSPTGQGTTATDSNGLTTTVTLVAGDNISDIDLGVFTPVSIGDLVWDDLDGDGVQDSGEPGIAGVTVTLDPGTPGDTGDDLTDTTDIDGNYSFTDLVEGTYTVTFTQPSGTTLSPTGQGTTATDSNGLTTTVTLVAGDNISDIDLGVYTPASIGDLVWDDTNLDGVQDTGEPGIAGVTVTLDPGTPGDTGDDLTDTTDSNGNYSFTGLDPGDYTITFTQPSGTGLSPTGQGTTATDTNGLTTTITLESGDDITDIDLGLYTLASIGDLVWLDTNLDGIQDTGEPGIAGVTVTLDPGTPGDTGDDLTDTTDSNGEYSFDGLSAGTYTVTFTQPSGTGLTLVGEGTTTTDSNGLTTTVTVVEGEVNDSIDLGLYELAGLGDLVWNDLDGDGIQDTGEPGIAGVTVTLDPGTPGDTGDDLTDTTDSNGRYNFDSLDPGTYTVTFTQPSGTGLSPTGAGTTTTDSNGLTTTVTLGSGESDLSIDLGVYTPVSIGNLVWDDLDGDGIQDIGEPGIAGVTVTLDPGTPGDTGDDLTDTTDSNGNYSFTGLDPGDYTITFTQPSGTTLSPTGQGTTATDTNGLTTTITLDSGESDLSIDLGVYTPASVGDLVWDDLDGDGIQDTGEPGIAGVTVTLDPGTPSNTGDDLTDTTDGDGVYSFDGLDPGTYTVTFTQPSGTTLSPTGQGTTATDSNGLTTTITLESGDDDADIDLGVFVAGSIAGQVWSDADVDGAQEGGEAALSGITVTLDPGTPSDTGDDLTDTTDGSGAYSFTGLAPGDYTVTFTEPAGYDVSIEVGGAPATDNDGLTTAVTLASGDAVTDIDLGLVEMSSIAGTVYHDEDLSGTITGGETGIVGVTVTLTGTDVNDNPVSLTDVTDADGNYDFPGLLPGTYQLTETQLSPWLDSYNTAGSAGGTVVADTIGSISLAAGTDATDYDFGEVRPTSIAGTVFVDDDVDGELDLTENGLETVTITLSGTDNLGNTVNESTTTGTDGTYSFTGLAPGTYSVVETQPTLYVDGIPTSAGSHGGTFGSSSISGIVLGSDDDATGYDFGELTPSGQVLLSKTATPDPTAPGGVVDFALAWENTGNVSVTGVTLTETVPSGSVFVASADTWSCDAGDPASTVCTLTVADLAPGGTGTARFSVQVDSPLLAPQATLPNTATITGTAQDPNGATPVTSSAGATPTVESTFIEGVIHLTDGTTDSPLAGATLALLDDGGDPVLDPATGEAWTIDVGADGTYRFDGLELGTYTVVETSPSGYGDFTGHVPSVTMTVGPTGAVQDFWHIDSSLSGTVFVDLDLDDGLTVGEPGLGGVTITLTGIDVNGDPVNRTTLTDTDGTYRFDNLIAGTYTVTESQPTAWPNGPTVTGDQGGSSSGTDDAIAAVGLGAGTDAAGYDFGEVGTSVSGTVFFDGTETPIAGVEIRLTGIDVLGNPVDRTITTGVDGNYRFDEVLPGDYTLTETQPNGLASGEVEPDDAQTITVGAAPVTDADFSERGSTISGIVTHDLDGNGIADTGEPGIVGVVMTLQGTTVDGDPVSRTTTTDADGNYRFDDLVAGTYTVTESQPDGYGNGTTETGSAGGSTGGSDDRVESISIDPGEDAVDYDFSEVTAPITGVVRVRDCSPTAGATAVPVGAIASAACTTGGIPIDGVRIDLLDRDGNVVATTTTDAQGRYSFDNVVSGDYVIVETQPAGYGSDSPDRIELAHGTTPSTADFEETMSSIGGRVFTDDGGEPVEGVTIVLTGVDVNGDEVRRTTTTGPDGSYEFTDLLSGEYTIVELQPDDYISGEVENDNRIPVSLDPGATDGGKDFSERLATGIISGTVFVDGTNTPIPDATVQLVDADGNVIQTTVTGADGTYTFTGLPSGTYTIIQIQPEGYAPGTVHPDNTITVQVDGDERVASNDFSESTGTDDPPPDGLAFSGASSLLLLLVGVVLTLLGGFAVAWRRRLVTVGGR